MPLDEIRQAMMPDDDANPTGQAQRLDREAAAVSEDASCVGHQHVDRLRAASGPDVTAAEARDALERHGVRVARLPSLPAEPPDHLSSYPDFNDCVARLGRKLSMELVFDDADYVFHLLGGLRLEDGRRLDLEMIEGASRDIPLSVNRDDWQRVLSVLAVAALKPQVIEDIVLVGSRGGTARAGTPRLSATRHHRAGSAAIARTRRGRGAGGCRRRGAPGAEINPAIYAPGGARDPAVGIGTGARRRAGSGWRASTGGLWRWLPQGSRVGDGPALQGDARAGRCRAAELDSTVLRRCLIPDGGQTAFVASGDRHRLPERGFLRTAAERGRDARPGPEDEPRAIAPRGPDVRNGFHHPRRGCRERPNR